MHVRWVSVCMHEGACRFKQQWSMHNGSCIGVGKEGSACHLGTLKSLLSAYLGLYRVSLPF